MAESTAPETKVDAPTNPPAPGAPPAPETAASTDSHKSKIDKALALEAGRQAKAAAFAVKNYLSKKGTIWSDLPQMFTSLFSMDRPTRRMALLFLLSLLGIISICSIALNRYWEAKKKILMAEAQRHAKHLSEIVKKETEDAKRRASLISLGKYTLELKELVQQKLGIGELNMAEVEIVILCDKKETREYIESHMVQVRNQMTNVLTAMDRDELSSRDGKRRLKTLVIRKLNEWLPHGKVEDLYFSKLVIN